LHARVEEDAVQVGVLRDHAGGVSRRRAVLDETAAYPVTKASRPAESVTS
jgi:hypothetical protein